MRWRGTTVALLCAVGTAAAHVPSFDEAGATPETAFTVREPTKSWVFYGSLDHEEAHWYRWDATAGMETFVSLHVPPGQDAIPRAWLLGPGLPDGAKPAGAPEGAGVLALEPTGDVSFEPFSPQALKDGGRLEMSAPAAGTYYVAVEAPGESVRYSVAIGNRESFTPWEWTTIPVERVPIQSWGGIPWPITLVGEVLGAAAGAFWAWRTKRRPRAWVGAIGAGLVAGSAVSLTILTGVALWWSGWSWGVLIPLVFAAAAVGIGYGAWRTVHGTRRWAGAGWAILAVVAWSGALAGPVLLLAWGAWPPAKRP